MNEDSYRAAVIAGAVLVVLGAFAVAAGVAESHRPYQPPPGCDVNACPYHGDGGEGLLFIAVLVILLGLGVMLGAAAIGVHIPLSRGDEEALLERFEHRGRIG